MHSILPQARSPFGTRSFSQRGDKLLLVPAVNTIIKVPDDAARFISDHEARQKLHSTHFRAISDLTSFDEANGLVYHYHTYFPNVIYHVDWYDNTVNAFAWVENGVRHVALIRWAIATSRYRGRGCFSRFGS
jgi:hypothetical protein